MIRSVAVLAAIAVALAPAAHADEYDYLDAVDNDPTAWFSGPASSFLAAGYQVCAALANGHDPNLVAFALWNDAYPALDPWAAARIVIHADNHLC